MQILYHPISRVCACALAFCVCFAIFASPLSHQLFLWGDVSYPAERSKFVLWSIYAAFGVAAGVVMYFCKPSLIEALAIGAACSVAAGGAYCIGYAQPVVILVIAAAVFAAAFFILRGGTTAASVVRALYICVGVSLAVSLATFLGSANNLREIKDLTGLTNNTSTSVNNSSGAANGSAAGTSSGAASGSASATQTTNTQWALMSATQRETYLSDVVAAEAKRLGLGTVAVVTCILPEGVAATADDRGRVLINFAAVRVASPEPSEVADFEAKNGVSWTYEELTSPRDIVLAACHAVAHVYQQNRVAGSLGEQKTWPYEDASDADGNNTVLDTWAECLPVDARADDGSTSAASTNLLESQAWGYAYTRVSSYVVDRG